MFYCDKCQVKHDLPDRGGPKSYGPCELCGNMAGCHDVPCSQMPDKPPPAAEWTKYTDWLESDARKKQRNFVVTYKLPGPEDMSSVRCEVLQWEDSNAKWYRLGPFENREEAGCYFDIWTHLLPGAPITNQNSRIIHVRKLYE